LYSVNERYVSRLCEKEKDNDFNNYDGKCWPSRQSGDSILVSWPSSHYHILRPNAVSEQRSLFVVS